MAARRLDPNEAALWAKVIETVRPIRVAPPKPEPVPVATVAPPPEPAPPKRPRGRIPPPRSPATAERKAPIRTVEGNLDGGWDRRISRGQVAPDSTVDLHGHTLSSAHAALDHGLERAIVRGDRVLLLVTGRPPCPESERPHARGAIRAAVHDWLAAWRHGDAIAAVRSAHPRHGGAGALYLILRRPRGV